MAVTKPTLHNSIREQMIREVQELHLEQRLPSDRQLAKRFGVALLTINKVMESLERDGYVDRIQGKGTILASREQRIRVDGRSGRRSQARVVVATPNYFSFEYWARSQVAGELARKHGYQTMDYRFGSAADYAGLLALLHREQDVAGVLLAPPSGSLSRAVVEELDTLGVPVVIFYECPWVSLTQHVYALVPDWFQSGYLSARCLLDAGRRHLAYVDNEPPEFGDARVKEGVKQALYEAKLRLKDLIRPEPRCRPGDDSRVAGYAMAQEALAQGADALICTSFAGAIAAYKAIWERGLRIPDDVSIVAGSGFNNQESFMAPPLTTVEASVRHEMETAYDLIAHPQSLHARLILSEVQVQLRASVAGPLPESTLR